MTHQKFVAAVYALRGLQISMIQELVMISSKLTDGQRICVLNKFAQISFGMEQASGLINVFLCKGRSLLKKCGKFNREIANIREKFDRQEEGKNVNSFFDS